MNIDWSKIKTPATLAQEIATIERDAWKAQRATAVANITVTTSTGKVFDGDEISQGRISRAIVALQSQPEASTIKWVLSDNTVAQVDIKELREALTMAVFRQTELWVQA